MVDGIIKPLDTATFNSEQSKEWTAIQALRTRNVARIEQLESMGIGLDLSIARLEHLMVALHALTLISTSELLMIQKDWELNLRTQTKEILTRAESNYAEAQKQQRQQKVVQTGRTDSGLIVPPSAATAVE